MNTYLFASVADMWLVTGWTMIHFLWLGALVGLIALCCRWLFRRTSATSRYGVSITWLILVAALPVAIAMWLATISPPLKGGAGGGTTISAASPTAVITPKANASPQTRDFVDLRDQPAKLESPAATVVDRPISVAADSAAAEPSPRPSLSGRGIPLVVLIGACIPYLPWVWLIGTPITFAFTATGLIGTRRLRRASRPITDGPIAEALEKLAASLRLTRRVAVAVCDRIAAPVLIGILRPIILLPPAALTGYSPDEIEMVLLHELAHVRRWDNLVNLIQRLIESILFFHPAVWLISNWVRREREACCDALVVTRTDRPHAYAELLVALAAQMPRSVLFHPAASSAMAAGPLRSRIRRILKLDDDPMLISGKSFALMLVALVVAAALALLYGPAIGQADQSTQNEAQTVQTQNNLRKLAIALLNYHEKEKVLPAHARYGAEGKPLLSWRVLILPYLDEGKLYSQFHLDEPWDSEHNRKLIPRMPAVFKNPAINERGKTNYLGVVGPECVFNGSPKGLTIASIADGTAHTITVVEANKDRAVEWTKPQDWTFDRQHPVEGLGALWPKGCYATLVDGSVRRLDFAQPPDVIGIEFTRNGRENHSLQESANRKPADPMLETVALDASPSGGAGPGENPASAATEKVKSSPEAVSNADAGAQTLATFPLDWPAANNGEYFKQLGEAFSKNLRIDLVRRGDQILVIGRPQPTEIDWPAVLGEPPRKERVIAERAWQRLGLKLVPLTRIESDYRRETGKVLGLSIAGGNVPKGLPAASILTKLNGTAIDDFDQLFTWLNKEAGTSDNAVVCIAVADDKQYLFDAEPPDEPRLGLAAPASNQPEPSALATSNKPPYKFPSLEEQKLADMAWKRLQLELEPLGKDDLNWVKAYGYDGGVKVAAVGGDKNTQQYDIKATDILVRLNIWPTTSMQDVSQILARDDLAELNPLKFYVVRTEYGADASPVVTGRITVKLPQSGFHIGGQFPSRSDYFYKSTSQSPTPGDPFKPKPQVATSADDPKMEYLSQQVEMAQLVKMQALAKRQQATGDQEVEAAKRELDKADRQLEEAKRQLADVQRAAEANLQSASKKIEAAMKAKQEAMAKRQQAKDRDAVEAAKRELEKADRQLEDAKRSLEKEIHSAETGNSNAQPIPEIKSQPLVGEAKPLQTPVVNEPGTGFEPLTKEKPSQPAAENSVHDAINPVNAALKEKQAASNKLKTAKSDADKEAAKNELETANRHFEDAHRVLVHAIEAQRQKIASLEREHGQSKWVATPPALNTPEFPVIAEVDPYHQTPTAIFKREAVANAPVGTVVVPNVEQVKVADRFVDPFVVKKDAHTPRPVVEGEASTDAATPPATSEEVKILREYVDFADDQFKQNDALYQKGAKGGSKDKREIAAYELALAQADLALAEGKRDQALAKLIEARASAEEAYKAVAAAYQAGRVSYDLLRNESRNLSDIKLKVAHLQQGNSASSSKQKASQIEYYDFTRTPTTERPPAKPDLLRYDGKTFDNWCHTWQTDLSTVKRTEAVKAIAAFGANGYGPEAAATLMELAGQYEWKTIGDNLATVPLQIACINAFGGNRSSANNIAAVAQSVPAKDALAEFAAIVKSSSNRNQKLFLTYVLPVFSNPQSVELRLVLSKDDDPLVRSYGLASLPRLSETPDNDKVAARIREALQSKDADEVLAALGRLMPSEGHRVTLPPEFTSTLLSPDERACKLARKVAQYAKDDEARRVANEVLAILNDESRKDQHVESVRALAVLRSSEKPVAEKLRSLVKSDDQSLSIASLHALRRILSQADYNKVLVDTFGERLGIGLANRGISFSIPGDPQKFQEYQAFDHAIAEEQKQLFP